MHYLATDNLSINSYIPFRKTMLTTTMGIALFAGMNTASAALGSGVTLSITLGDGSCAAGGTWPNCNYGANVVTSGSFFTMDGGFGALLESDLGIELGSTQPFDGTVPSSGNPYPGDGTNIVKAWPFFGNTGTNFTSSAVNANSDTELDMAGWRVAWGEVPSINMGGGGTATISCGTCLDGDAYTLDYSAVVPPGDPSGFGGVLYAMHLEGTLSFPGSPPITNPDSAKTIVGNTVNIDVLANDSSADGLDTGSVAIATAPSPGSATPQGNGTIDYTPASAGGTNDSFQYTVDSSLGVTSSATDVDVSIETNVAPVANNDSINTNTGALDNAGGSISVDVVKNDTDVNNDPGLPGGINVATVSILTQPSTGTCSANADGTVTYTQPKPIVTASTSCNYNVMDIDSFGGGAGPLSSNTASIDIEVTSLDSDWPTALDPDIIPFLVYEDGVPNSSGNTAQLPESGTYFSMDVSASTTIYTTLTKGPDGGFIIGYDQPAQGSHTGSPTGNETASVDLGWNFFGNTGLSFTKNGGITGNTDGTLKFSGDPSVNNGQGKFQITWNGIPEIDLGGSDKFPDDLGFSLITCNPAPCANGSTFDLDYKAHVPPGDPSGFGGVQYGLFMTGTVAFLDGRLQSSSGTITLEERLSQDDVEPDPDSEIQCAGGCFNYTITGVTDPNVSVVLPLNGGVPASTPDGDPQMRVFRNGGWDNFDTSTGDTVLSAQFTSGGDFGTTCPPAGDAAYGVLTESHQCVQVTIADNGPNDKDPAVGTISDPSGLGIPTITPEPDNRKSGSSGCSIASNSSSPEQGGAWWFLAGLTALLGWYRKKNTLQ